MHRVSSGFDPWTARRISPTSWQWTMPDLQPTQSASKPLSLTDSLAVDRTVLANERTLLAYVRTGLGLLALGVTFLDFLTGRIYSVVGWAFIVLGPLLLIAGTTRYLAVRRRLTPYQPTGADHST